MRETYRDPEAPAPCHFVMVRVSSGGGGWGWVCMSEQQSDGVVRIFLTHRLVFIAPWVGAVLLEHQPRRKVGPIGPRIARHFIVPLVAQSKARFALTDMYVSAQDMINTRLS